MLSCFIDRLMEPKTNLCTDGSLASYPRSSWLWTSDQGLTRGVMGEDVRNCQALEADRSQKAKQGYHLPNVRSGIS